MIRGLHIKNFVLVDSATLTFGNGFNILTGETGAGKSALLGALSIALGARADVGLVRKGADKGVVEATFSIDALPAVQEKLESLGIDHESGSELIIRREVHASGKSRAFINQQLVQVTCVREIGTLLAKMVGQHANLALLDVDHQRNSIDLFGDLTAQVKAFAASWQEEKTLRAERETLLADEQKRLREIDVCQMELTELDEASLQEEEEETLFIEYTRLTHGEEMVQKAYAIGHALHGTESSLLSTLQQQTQTFEALTSLDPSLEESLTAYRDATLELEEVAHTLSSYQNSIELNPARTEEVNNRLALITRLKRKYGPNISDVLTYQEQLRERLVSLESTDDQIETLSVQITEVEEKNTQRAKQLTSAREKAAKQLKNVIEKSLHSLNMPKAEFRVEIRSQKRTHHGDDAIEFFLKPNVGEKEAPVRECASGGELSRLLLALQTVLAGKEATPTLIFDEIDANIGGETATVVGEQLKKIGKQHQILCITHFPQVAQHAQDHFKIDKRVVEGRTLTLITFLPEEKRQSELTRMIGGKGSGLTS